MPKLENIKKNSTTIEKTSNNPSNVDVAQFSETFVSL
jgi:hypothetical protein